MPAVQCIRMSNSLPAGFKQTDMGFKRLIKTYLSGIVTICLVNSTSPNFLTYTLLLSNISCDAIHKCSNNMILRPWPFTFYLIMFTTYVLLKSRSYGTFPAGNYMALWYLTPVCQLLMIQLQAIFSSTLGFLECFVVELWADIGRIDRQTDGVHPRVP